MIVWVKPISYEVNIDETKEIELINDPIDPKFVSLGSQQGKEENLQTKNQHHSFVD